MLNGKLRAVNTYIRKEDIKSTTEGASFEKLEREEQGKTKTSIRKKMIKNRNEQNRKKKDTIKKTKQQKLKTS